MVRLDNSIRFPIIRNHALPKSGPYHTNPNAILTTTPAMTPTQLIPGNETLPVSFCGESLSIRNQT